MADVGFASELVSSGGGLGFSSSPAKRASGGGGPGELEAQKVKTKGFLRFSRVFEGFSRVF